jgi:RNA 2',3'-cyclic 3'-phosphodiesterase
MHSVRANDSLLERLHIVTKRLFLAVDLAINVVEQLVLLQDELAEAIATLDTPFDVRWVEAPNIHLTLKFLGATDEALIPMIASTVDRLAAPLFPFEVECRGVGCFPDPRRPRILYAGLDAKGGEVLGLLEQALQRDLGELGVEADDREFKPHITLGRVKSQTAPTMETVLPNYQTMRFGKSYIKDIILFESLLSSRGPRYEVVHRFALGR